MRYLPACVRAARGLFLMIAAVARELHKNTLTHFILRDEFLSFPSTVKSALGSTAKQF